jgi:chemotaxis protein CheZ
VSDQALNTGDSDELEALFDSIVRANTASEDAPTAPAAGAEKHTVAPTALNDLSEPARSMFSHIGQLTRKLHDTLRELGLDKSLEKAASEIPDARDRLAYVASMTEQAADRTLNALDIAKPMQEKIGDGAREINAQWDQLLAGKLSIEEFKLLVEKTRVHLKYSADMSDEINTQMMEIMMAQDFQDLTGQVIKKVLTMTKEMEQQLLDFLLMFSPQGIKPEEGLLNGPVVRAEGRTDVVTDQQQVDDLLESLGF